MAVAADRARAAVKRGAAAFFAGRTRLRDCAAALIGAALLQAARPGLTAAGTPPLADVHVHYKWNQAEVTTPRQAVDILEANNIALAVVIGMPAEYAQRLEALAPRRVIPAWSPYRRPGDWSTWAFDKEVPERARRALESGDYHAIGELHLIGGFAPHWQTPVIGALAELAAEFDVPLLVHTEISRPDYMQGLCGNWPDTRILWAHAGALLTPGQVAGVMEKCGNLWVELSARDPWRFVNNPVTGADGALSPDWRALLEAFPDRVMVGSDPVWPVEKLDSWEQADTGWQEYGRFVDFHRRWLGKLPRELAGKVRLENARAFFRHDDE